MKNKILTISFLLLVVLSSVNFVSSQEINYSVDYSNKNIQISSVKYEPYPANPGEYFDFWVRVYMGSSKYAKIEFVEDFPFSLDNDEDLIKEIDKNGDYLLHYVVRVDKDAVEGINKLKLKISSNKYTDVSVTKEFEISIANAQTDFDLVVQDYSTSEISLAIANIGKNSANSMVVRIPEQNNFVATGTNGQMVGNLDSGDYTIVSFSLNKLIRNANSLLVQIDYTDNIGERRSVIKEVPIISSSSSISLNSSNITGMATNGFPEGFQRKNKTNWSYIIIPLVVVAVAVGGFFIHKNKEKISKTLKKKKEKSDDIPEWIKKNK